MRGKAQPDGRPAVELIQTLVLISQIVAKVLVQRRFLPRDASAQRGDATVSRPSVCLSVRLSVRL